VFHLTGIFKGNIEVLVEVLRGFLSTHYYVIQALGYNQRNSERIRNGEFRTKGLFVSSAVVEAGSKNFIGARLKKA